jgi:hypothetical protein
MPFPRLLSNDVGIILSIFTIMSLDFSYGNR